MPIVIKSPKKRLLVNLRLSKDAKYEEPVPIGSRIKVYIEEGAEENFGFATHIEAELKAVRGGPPSEEPIEIKLNDGVTFNEGTPLRNLRPIWFPRKDARYYVVLSLPGEVSTENQTEQTNEKKVA